MTCRSLAAAGLVFALTAIATAGTAGAPDAGRPLRLRAAGDGHVTVNAHVDHKGPFPFILDTGADGSAVYPWIVQTLGLHKRAGEGMQLSGQTGDSRVDTYRLGHVSLGGVDTAGIEAVGLPARHDNGQEAGVLGNDVMDHAVVAFDFACGTVHVYRKPAPIAAIVGTATAVPDVRVVAGTTLLRFPVTINGARGVAVLDTGSRRTRLTPTLARRAGLDPASSRFHNAAPIYGTSQTRKVPREGPIGRLVIAGHVVAGAQVEVVDLPALKQYLPGTPAMLLGADILGRFRLIYDHATHRVWMQASKCRRDAGKADPARRPTRRPVR